MSWYSKPGDNNREDFRKNKMHSHDLFRFFLKPGESRTVLFLDDAQFGIKEYLAKVGGRFKNFTESEENSVIFSGSYSSYAEYYTILDLTPYVDKQGTKRFFSKRAIGIKGDGIDTLDRRRKSAGGSLVGKKVKITRDGKKSPSSGNDFEVVGETDIDSIPLDKLNEFARKPYDFVSVMEPLSPDRISSIMKYSANGGDQYASGRDEFNQDPFGGTTENVDKGASNHVTDPNNQPPSFTEDDIPF